MTMTTIKVSRELRDRLKVEAEREGKTLGGYIERLAELDAREKRWEALRVAMANTSPEDWASYRAETEEWERADLTDLAKTEW